MDVIKVNGRQGDSWNSANWFNYSKYLNASVGAAGDEEKVGGGDIKTSNPPPSPPPPPLRHFFLYI